MDQQQLFLMLPGVQPDEVMLLQNLMKHMSETQQQQFLAFYRGKRKEKKDLLLYTVIGFFGVAGIQRFMLGETGMGVLYLLTGGLCSIGTIVDLINLDNMTNTHNQRQAVETANMVRAMA